jgi:hypothetical protein
MRALVTSLTSFLSIKFTSSEVTRCISLFFSVLFNQRISFFVFCHPHSQISSGECTSPMLSLNRTKSTKMGIIFFNECSIFFSVYLDLGDIQNVGDIASHYIRRQCASERANNASYCDLIPEKNLNPGSNPRIIIRQNDPVASLDVDRACIVRDLLKGRLTFARAYGEMGFSTSTLTFPFNWYD